MNSLIARIRKPFLTTLTVGTVAAGALLLSSCNDVYYGGHTRGYGTGYGYSSGLGYGYGYGTWNRSNYSRGYRGEWKENRGNWNEHRHDWNEHRRDWDRGREWKGRGYGEGREWRR